MSVTQKQKRILICVVYNLILEFWVHSILGFLNPVLTISLLFLYLSYFSMLEDLVVRYKLRDHHVLLIGFIFGLFHEIFTTGSMFTEPTFLGINIIILFLANVFWWGILQSIFGLYFANTIVERSEVDKKMGPIGWILALAFNILLFLGRILEGTLPSGSILGYTLSLIILGVAVALFIVIKKPEEELEIEQIRFINILLKVQIVICLVMGFVLIFIIGIIALYLFILWSIFTGIIYIIFAIKGKRFIGIVRSTD
ncbi:MAG: hypothetical protein EU532_00265 [Promethearchaeota archaeon]|nr:MAG: hypothetical protein EU532_00265 [Candidatus Lokiarchaeota archaeon]